VHIGAPKTGTTLVQRVCFDNRDALTRLGVLYPDVSLRGYGHHDLAFLLAGGYPAWATPQAKTLDDLSAELMQATARHDGSLLLSSEDFYLCPNPHGLRALLDRTGISARFEPRIIVYLRRQDDAHESWYNQTIKAQGSVDDLETCIVRAHDLWDYARNLTAWEGAFGRSALDVRLYQNGAYAGGSLLTDFCFAIGVDAAELAVPAERVNGRINADILEFQRLTNRLPLTVVEKRRYHRELIALTEATEGLGLFDEAPLIGAARRRSIMASYAAGNAAVAERFFDCAELFAEPPASNAAVDVERGLTTAKLASIVGWLLARK
jgi:hypothetical protein